MPKIEYIENLLFFWIKGKIYFENNILKLENPHYILGIIPTGRRKKNVPVNQISSVETDFKLSFKTLIWGLLLLLFGFSGLGQDGAAVIGLIFMVLGAAQIASAFQSVVKITLTSGEEVPNEFVIFERAKAEQAEENINQLILSKIDH